LSETGRDLVAVAKKQTSSSGSIPIIYIYYFGYLGALVVLIFTVFILKFIFEFLIALIEQSGSGLILILASLVIIRIYKYFVVGSPGYLYNKQIVFYVLFALIIYIIQSKVYLFGYSVNNCQINRTNGRI